MKHKTIKKTLDVPKELHKQILDIVENNYGMTFTQAAIQAFERWVENPKVNVKLPHKGEELPKRGRVS